MNEKTGTYKQDNMSGDSGKKRNVQIQFIEVTSMLLSQLTIKVTLWNNQEEPISICLKYNC